MRWPKERVESLWPTKRAWIMRIFANVEGFFREYLFRNWSKTWNYLSKTSWGRFRAKDPAKRNLHKWATILLELTWSPNTHVDKYWGLYSSASGHHHIIIGGGGDRPPTQLTHKVYKPLYQSRIVLVRSIDQGSACLTVWQWMSPRVDLLIVRRLINLPL